MRHTTILLFMLLVSISTWAVGPRAHAADPFAALDYTDFSSLQVVGSSGDSTYTLPGDGLVKLKGVVLNTPSAMANSAPASNSTPFSPTPIWQIFVQTIDENNTGDFGGVAVFMAQNYGNIPPHFPPVTPSANYTAAEWTNQVNRVNSFAQNTAPAPHALQAGDVVDIYARWGLEHAGKFNINENHNKVPDYNSDPMKSFDIIYKGTQPLVPTHIQLASIWDEGTHAVKFDSSRATGGEHYQSTLVSLDNVHLVSGSWLPDQYVTVADAAGRQFPLHLGLQLTAGTAPVGWFDVVGIFNQEAPGQSPNNIGYEVWVMDPNGITLVPEPASWVLAILALAGLFACKRRTGAEQ